MLTFPNAKINLGLRILRKRSDGYHTLESLFLPIDWCDALEITLAPSSQDKWTQRGIPIGGEHSDNTIFRTIALLRERFAIPALHIELLKKIPFGAGLGGGSADAAFALKMLNEQFALGLTHNDMVKLIARVGADCPFFIANEPALATGIGEKLSPISLPQSLRQATLLLVKPPFGIATKQAYAGVTLHPEAEGSLVAALEQPVERWQELLVNDFEESLFPYFPRLGVIKKQLLAIGAFYAAMTGSGSTLFGFFESDMLPSFPEDWGDCVVWQGKLL